VHLHVASVPEYSAGYPVLNTCFFCPINLPAPPCENQGQRTRSCKLL
jgi:hypothetical protein